MNYDRGLGSVLLNIAVLFLSYLLIPLFRKKKMMDYNDFCVCFTEGQSTEESKGLRVGLLPSSSSSTQVSRGLN